MGCGKGDCDQAGNENSEPNLFVGTLESAKTTIETSRDNVYDGSGSPTDAVGTAVAAGWVCTEATTWSTELTEECAGILDAFDDAAQTVQTEINGAPCCVAEGHRHGNSWPTSWHQQRNNL